MIRAALLVMSGTLVLSGLSVLAHGQAQVEASAAPQSSIADGWPVLLASIVTTAGAVAHAWITSNSTAEKQRADAEKRRADRAEDQLREMVDQLEELAAEKRAVEKERDRLVRWAYSHGYHSADDIPTRKDEP